ANQCRFQRRLRQGNVAGGPSDRPRAGGNGRCTDAHTVDLQRDGADPSRVPARRGRGWPRRAAGTAPPARDPACRRRTARERRVPPAARRRVMGAIGIALTVLVVALLWVAAVAFGRDSRDGTERRFGPDER